MKINQIPRPWIKRSQTRYNPDPWYNSAEWKSTRARKLALNPFCECDHCKGKNVKADMVDHIQPIKQGGSRTDMSNLQSLTNRCHARKSAEDKNRKYKKT